MTVLDHVRCLFGWHAWFIYDADRIVCLRCGHIYEPDPQLSRVLRGRDRG